MSKLPPAVTYVEANAWRHGHGEAQKRAVPEEVAVALSYDHETFAVMMASPGDLQDFSVGFSISEGIINDVSDIVDFSIQVLKDGIECRMRLAPRFRTALQARRRRIAGPVGCGLCGMESLREAARPVLRVEAPVRMAAADIASGFARMAALQTLNHETHAVHAAAFLSATGDMFLREDIGRHNALDKLIGAALRNGVQPATGAVLLTSRVSLDLIQKAAACGAGILAAISVPSALAVRAAEAAGISLIAVARNDGFEIFTHPRRVMFEG